ncbi:conjugative transposon protein TraN [Pedobacter sp. ASV28]|uniref:conjugative transposon protein TraN n=1 Tax=Pedobacter sp. ASV28 TaxID=2795123 RepID=UPI0018EC1B7E|nr:conjugative transposon protein TraN [Pedobacter sp. ASV28]
MKRFIVFLMAVLCFGQLLFAQQSAGTKSTSLPDIFITGSNSIHFISPENIQYVDITSHAVAGDLPLKNLLRLKMKPDTIQAFKSAGEYLGIVTIVGESFIAQYNLHFIDNPTFPFLAQINILPEHSRPLDIPGMSLTSKEMQAYAVRMMEAKIGRPKRSAKDFGIQARLNNVFTAGDYVFLDISYFNDTNLSYQIDEQRFKIDDKKITKATNVQSVEVKPVWQLYNIQSFKKHYRNIYVIKKATFPGNKVMNIELTEKQLSGRMLTLKLKYGDILRADSF